MRYYRSLPLAALLAGLALPAAAQPSPSPGMTQPETAAPAPKSGADAALPDAGVRKTAPEKIHHHKVRRGHPVAF